MGRYLFLNWMDLNNPKSGGAEKYATEMAKRFVRDGNVVELFTTSYRGSTSVSVINGVKVIRTGNPLTVYLRAFFYLKANVNSYDKIIEFVNGPPFYSPLLTNDSKTRGVLFHFPTMKAYIGKLYLLGPIEYAIQRISLLIFYRNIPFLTDGKYTMKELERIKIRNVVIAEDGIDVSDLDISYDVKENLVVITGPIKPWKRIEDAIVAFSKTDQRWRLVVIGRGSEDYIRKLKELSRKLRVQDRINFAGFIDESEKHSLYVRSKINIVTSEKEGFALTALEAMSFGSVCIAYDIPGVRDALVEGITSLIVPDSNIEKLTEELISLTENETRIMVMMSEGIKRARNFTWERTYEKFAEFLNS